MPWWCHQRSESRRPPSQGSQTWQNIENNENEDWDIFESEFPIASLDTTFLLVSAEKIWSRPFFDTFWLVEKTIENAQWRIYHCLFNQSDRVKKNRCNQSISFIGADPEERKLWGRDWRVPHWIVTIFQLEKERKKEWKKREGEKEGTKIKNPGVNERTHSQTTPNPAGFQRGLPPLPHLSSLPSSILSDFKDCRCLWPPYSHDFLGDTDRSTAHPDTKTISTSVDKVLGLCCRYHIPRYDLQGNDSIPSCKRSFAEGLHRHFR